MADANNELVFSGSGIVSFLIFSDRGDFNGKGLYVSLSVRCYLI